MTPSSRIRSVYDPDTLSIMTNAFDGVLKSIAWTAIAHTE